MISKIIVENFEKVQYLCVLLFCYEMLWEFQISLLQILKYITKCL